MTQIKTRQQFIFTLVVTILGFIAVFILNHFIFYNSSHSLYTLGLVLFPLPILFTYTLQLFLNIPDKIYKKWYFPVDHEMPNLDLLDLSRVLIIQFELLKSTSEISSTNFKAKAPLNMPFGELFYIFINDYNESHPQNIIEVLNDQQTPFPWIFTVKTPWWKGAKNVDPDLTFQENGIINNDIVFCLRVNP